MAKDQRGFYFDQSICLGCDACVAACRAWHGLDAGMPDSRTRVSLEEGKYPEVDVAHFISTCLHCEEPGCVAICPAKAITKREDDGVVVVDMEKCRGPEDCGHPCSTKCPAGTDTPEVMARLQQGDLKGAMDIIVYANPLPGVTGRVCFHPCETACNRAQVDEAVAIHNLERFLADNAPREAPQRAPARKERVAVVGSGPAGLSCAYQLARLGYQVTVFEALPVAGGMLRTGIPGFRLDKAVLDREIEFVRSAGVEIKTNIRLGKELSFSDLEKFDAVFIATGAPKDRIPPIPGTDLKGVYSGLDFLRQVNLGLKLNVGNRVVIIGGGNVAMDCARTALRLGASSVSVACLESRQEMPADAEQVVEAEEEGIILYPSRSFNRITGNGRVTGVECMKLKWMQFDRKGRLTFEAEPGSEHVLPADAVIIATGQAPDTGILPEDIRVTPAGVIKVNDAGATTRDKFYAGGDVAVGIAKRRVTWAIGMGRKAAAAIDRKLRGLGRVSPKSDDAEYRMPELPQVEKKARVAVGKLAASERKLSFREVESGLALESAMREAQRCLLCRGMCHVVCAYGAPQFISRVKTHMFKCDMCLDRTEKGKEPACVSTCPVLAIECGPLTDLIAKHGTGRKAQGFRDSPAAKPAVVLKGKK